MAAASPFRTVSSHGPTNLHQARGRSAVTPAVASLMSTLDDARVFASPSKAKSGSLRPVTLGFIALTDCASLVMAKELGYFEDRGLDVTCRSRRRGPQRATRCSPTRSTVRLASSACRSLGGDGIGRSGRNTSLKIAMVLNNNGQAITLKEGLCSSGIRQLGQGAQGLSEDADHGDDLSRRYARPLVAVLAARAVSTRRR